jgi:transcriptional regulator with XRE-family HTH domain
MSTIYIRGSQDLGQLIATARRKKGLSQRQVADALKVTQAWVSHVERGSQMARIGQVLRLAAYLEVPIWGSLDPENSSETKNDAAYDLNKLLEL